MQEKDSQIEEQARKNIQKEQQIAEENLLSLFFFRFIVTLGLWGIAMVLVWYLWYVTGNFSNDEIKMTILSWEITYTEYHILFCAFGSVLMLNLFLKEAFRKEGGVLRAYKRVKKGEM